MSSKVVKSWRVLHTSKASPSPTVKLSALKFLFISINGCYLFLSIVKNSYPIALSVSAQLATGHRCNDCMLPVTSLMGGEARGSAFKLLLRSSLALRSAGATPLLVVTSVLSAGSDDDRLCLQLGGTQSPEGFSYDVSKGNSPTRNRCVLVGKAAGFGGFSADSASSAISGL